MPSNEQAPVLARKIQWFGRECTLSCDAKCSKAWGINNRPKRMLSATDVDDYEFYSDDEAGIAPGDPGTYEGGHAKPRTDGERLNKWCAREAQRLTRLGDLAPLTLPDFSVPVRNKGGRPDAE